MENKFKYSLDNKRYHTWNYYLRKKFGGKVFKVSLNGGFTCPNIDGTRGCGGCTYCSSMGSGDFAGDPKMNIIGQFHEVKKSLHKKWPEAKYIAYFQANTNTYDTVENLKKRFEPVLAEENVVGLSIATRADCLPDDVVEYLADLNERTSLIVELGLQSIYDKTGERINRCHTYSEFLEGYNKLKDKGIDVCVHLIIGLPGETPEMMIESAKTVAALKPHSIKLHLLHILKDTAIEKEYLAGEFEVLSRDEYVKIIVDILEILPEDIVLQRLTGDGGKESLVAPLWSLKKFVVLNEIDKEMVRRNCYQGDKKISC